MRRSLFMSVLTLMVAALATAVFAQQSGSAGTVSQARDALRKALAERNAVSARGKKLEAAARQASAAAERTAQEGAVLAARIQQAEAAIAVADARIAIINEQRAQLKLRLAERREPLVRLTGALQKLARRPLALSALKPGSVRETVYLRAILASTIPQVQHRTAALRAEIDRGRTLEKETQQVLAGLQASEAELVKRQKRLITLETQQRLTSRRTRGNANREKERALALAEEARDLNALVERFGVEAIVRRSLAQLPGPIVRPDSPERNIPRGAQPSAPSATVPGSEFQLPVTLPVTGRTVAGFGEADAGGVRNKGITIAPRGWAQVTAPARGRVAFSGQYRGYDQIVILEHDDGWTSLVTGMARTDVSVGDHLVAGAPMGVAGADNPVVTLEIRRNGQPVNPLDYIR